MSYGVGQKGFADLQAQYSGQQIAAAKAIKPTITKHTEKEMDAGDILGELAGIGLAAYGTYKGLKKPKSNKIETKPEPEPELGQKGFNDTSSSFNPYEGVSEDTLLGIAKLMF